MARREWRASPGKFAAAALVMAIAASGAFALRSITYSFAGHARENAREWIAADVMASYYGPPPTPEQWDAVTGLGPGVDSTLVADLPVALSSDNITDPLPAEIKVVDPAAYPYYGRLQVRSGRAPRELLDAGSVIVSPDIPRSLNVQVGDTIGVNGVDFQIRDLVEREPDRYATPPPMTGRLILSQDALDRLGGAHLPKTGAYRILLRIAPQTDRRSVCSRLEEIFPDAQVTDYTSRTMQSVTMNAWVIPLLNWVGFLFVALGGAAIAGATYFHLLRNRDTVATLKCLGASTGAIKGVYLLQELALAFGGSLAGVAAGRFVEAGFGVLAARLFRVNVEMDPDVSLAAGTVLLGILAAAVPAWILLHRIRSISPALLQRREAPPVRRPLRSAWFRLLQRRFPWALRASLANLRRYGKQSRVVMLALTGGIAIIVMTFLGQRHLGSYMLEAIPFHSPSLLVINIDSPSMTELSRVLAAATPEGPQYVAERMVTLASAGDLTLAKLRAARPDFWIQRDWRATCSDSLPLGLEVVSGSWWSPSAAEPAVALNEDLARLWGVSLGSMIGFLAGSQPILARVHALVRIPSAQQIWRGDIVFNCRALPGTVYSGAIPIPADRLPEVRRLLHERFPDMLFLDVREMIRGEERQSREGFYFVRMVGVLAAAMAGALLAGMLASQRAFRVHEIAVLRALGARKASLLGMLAVEHAVIGGISGLAGALLGCAALSVILRYAAGIDIWALDVPVICWVTGSAAGFTATVALAASRPLLRPKPLEILRTQ